MRTQDIQGRLGLIGVHPEDPGLHATLLGRLRAEGQGQHAELSLALTSNGLRHGEQNLAEKTAEWALREGVGVLVVAALRDNCEHDAAAWIGRWAARRAGLGLLALVGGNGGGPTLVPEAEPRSAGRPLVASDFESPPLTHPILAQATYLWTPKAGAASESITVTNNALY